MIAITEGIVHILLVAFSIVVLLISLLAYADRKRPRPTFYMPDHERTQIIHPHSVTIHGYQSPLTTKTPQLHLVHATQNSSLRGELTNRSPIFRPALPEEKPQTSSILNRTSAEQALIRNRG